MTKNPKTAIGLSDHFNYKKMLQFTLPSIIMLIFTSVYGIVDGFFVSNFLGKTPFAAVNFIWPVLMLLGAIGFMFGAGGSALIAKTIGEGNKEKATSLFSLFVYISIALGIVLGVISFIFLPSIASLLGAEGQLHSDCVLYGRIIIASLPFYIVQFEFQTFFITAEKPKLGLYATIASGVTNIILDALFIIPFKWGIAGAALATALSQVVGGIIPLVYFGRPNTSLLRLTKTKFYGKSLLKVCSNGSSELMSNISMSIVSMLYNIQLMKYAGEDGVAAYGVLMYVCLVFLGAFIGFSTGIAPVVAYNFGAKNTSELKGLLKKSLVIIGFFSVGMLIFAVTMAYPLSYIFVGYDSELMDLTVRAFFMYSASFLFSGIAIFGSAFFTALNDGLTSALISFMRSLVFQIIAVIIFPLIWGIDGIWLSIAAAEMLSVVVTVLFLVKKRKKYNY